MLNIDIKTIPHDQQRYETPGDYWDDENPNSSICPESHVRISDLDNSDYEFLIAMHELVEMYLCRKRGIKEEDIKAFDEIFEREREVGLHKKDDEAGFDPRAPYRNEHAYATFLEKSLAMELGVNWKKYDKAVTSLLEK